MSEQLNARVLARIDASGDCWQWTGNVSNHGYGRYSRDHAHRVVWQLLVGSIPEGLTLDHLCRNRACVNPDHLEPVNNAENLRRGYSKSAQRARQTECRRGHPFDDANTWKDKFGRRYCKTCHADRERQYRKNRRDTQ